MVRTPSVCTSSARVRSGCRSGSTSARSPRSREVFSTPCGRRTTSSAATPRTGIRPPRRTRRRRGSGRRRTGGCSPGSMRSSRACASRGRPMTSPPAFGASWTAWGRTSRAGTAAAEGPALSDLLDILAAEVNVKAVQVVASDHDLVRLRGKANFRTLGKRYGNETPRAAAAVAELTAENLQALEQGGPVRSGEWEFRPEDVTVTREVASEWLVQADGPYVVALDPALSDDLVQEGLAREVVNRVQRLRKEAGYEYTTRIELSITGAADVVAAIRAFQGFVEGETLARRMVFGAVLDEPDLQRDVDIEGRQTTIALRRHDGRKGGTR